MVQDYSRAVSLAYREPVTQTVFGWSDEFWILPICAGLGRKGPYGRARRWSTSPRRSAHDARVCTCVREKRVSTRTSAGHSGWVLRGAVREVWCNSRRTLVSRPKTPVVFVGLLATCVGMATVVVWLKPFVAGEPASGPGESTQHAAIGYRPANLLQGNLSSIHNPGYPGILMPDFSGRF